MHPMVSLIIAIMIIIGGAILTWYGIQVVLLKKKILFISIWLFVKLLKLFGMVDLSKRIQEKELRHPQLFHTGLYSLLLGGPTLVLGIIDLVSIVLEFCQT